MSCPPTITDDNSYPTNFFRARNSNINGFVQAVDETNKAFGAGRITTQLAEQQFDSLTNLFNREMNECEEFKAWLSLRPHIRDDPTTQLAAAEISKKHASFTTISTNLRTKIQNAKVAQQFMSLVPPVPFPSSNNCPPTASTPTPLRMQISREVGIQNSLSFSFSHSYIPQQR